MHIGKQTLEISRGKKEHETVIWHKKEMKYISNINTADGSFCAERCKHTRRLCRPVRRVEVG